MLKLGHFNGTSGISVIKDVEGNRMEIGMIMDLVICSIRILFSLEKDCIRNFRMFRIGKLPQNIS